MATISIDNFGGIAPRVHPTLLGENMATVAHNCTLKSGKLVPLKEPARFEGELSFENHLPDISKAETLYLWRHGDSSTLLMWPGQVWIAPSNLSRDDYYRIMISGETGIGNNNPCVYLWENGAIRRHNLVKEPLEKPIARRNMATEVDTNRDVVSTAFIQSWVDKFGYESGASEPSEIIEYNDGDAILISKISNAPADAKYRYLYKVITGSEETAPSFQYIAKQEKVGNDFPNWIVSVRDEDAGEVLQDRLPPSSELEMVTRVPGNFYAGVERGSVREVRFSEIGNFSNWPDDYTAPVHDDIVGLAVGVNSVFVLTKSNPWVITGDSPSAMMPTMLASPNGCVSTRSICQFNGAIFYAGVDGFYMLEHSSATAANITAKMFSEREWGALQPKTCVAISRHDAILLNFQNGNKSFILNMTDSATAGITTHDLPLQACCVDRETSDVIFIGRGSNGL